jgi:hypothetical protein
MKKPIILEEIKEVNEITLVYIEAVLMPNKEIICNGKSLGTIDKVIRIYKNVHAS